MTKSRSSLHQEAPNEAGLDRVERSKLKVRTLFGGTDRVFAETDPVFARLRDRFVFGDVQSKVALPDAVKALVSLAVLTTIGERETIASHTRAALRAGASPEAIKETIYHTAPMIGFPKAQAALREVNSGLVLAGYPLPLPDAARVTEEDRLEAGREIAELLDIPLSGRSDAERIVLEDGLCGFACGDIATRGVVSLPLRALLWFVAAVAGHADHETLRTFITMNRNVGNRKEELEAAAALAMPYVGVMRAREIFSLL